MKVLFFNYEYPPLGGGAGNATSYILKEFSKINDLEIDLVTSAIDKNYSLEKIGDKIRIHKLPIGKDGNNLHYQSQKELLVYSWKAFWFTRQLIRQNKYDLTHSFFAVPCGALSWWLSFSNNLPYIVSLRGSDVPGYSERFSLVYKILTPAIRFIWKKSFFTVANSLEFKKLAQGTNPQQEIKIITNGIDGDEFYAKKFNPEATQREGEFKIICGSRITPRKGIRFIIEALDILRKKGVLIKLDIIGQGNERIELERKVQDLNLNEAVNFIGFVEHNKLPSVYAGANVYVSASLNEGMSNTLLEALSAGLPIIATNTGGTAETVTEGVNGYIIEMESAQSIVDKVEILFNDYQLEKKMSQASRALAEKMSWGNIAQEYYALYSEILDNNKKQ
jgi:glycosyltransferase involved in cell wall biosynthesis